MIIDGTGLIAQAFRRGIQSEAHAYLFARGVANSSCVDEEAYERERIMLTSAIGECRESGRKLIYLSGAPIHGTFVGPVTEETMPKPITRYGRHQADCEELIAASRVPYLVLRLANIVGSDANPDQLVPSLVSQIRRGHVVVHGRAGRDLLNVQDLVRLTNSFIQVGTAHRVVNVASGICSPVPDIVRWLMELLPASAQVDLVDTGEEQRFETGLLRRVLGPAAVFSPEYPREVLAHYVSP